MFQKKNYVPDFIGQHTFDIILKSTEKNFFMHFFNDWQTVLIDVCF